MFLKVFALTLVIQLAYSAPFERELQELAKDLQSEPSKDEYAFADYDEDLSSLDNDEQVTDKRSMSSQRAETIYKDGLLKQDEINKHLETLMAKTKALKDMLREVEKDAEKKSDHDSGSHLRKADMQHYHFDSQKLDEEIQKQLHDSAMTAHHGLTEKMMEDNYDYSDPDYNGDIDQENDGDIEEDQEDDGDKDDEDEDYEDEDEEDDEDDDDDEEDDEEEEEDEKENQLLDHLSNLKKHVNQLKDSLMKAKKDEKKVYGGAEPADVSNEINNEINQAVQALEADPAVKDEADPAVKDNKKRTTAAMLERLETLHSHLDTLKDTLKKDSPKKKTQKKKADPKPKRTLRNKLHEKIEKLKRDLLTLEDAVKKDSPKKILKRNADTKPKRMIRSIPREEIEDESLQSARPRRSGKVVTTNDEEEE